MEKPLGNAEFVLLGLIAERPAINGYVIRQLVEERGLSAWAGVASSSIYNGLKRIEKSGLAVSVIDTGRRSRGPTGKAFSLTPSGKKALREAVTNSLSATREYDPRFNIALSSIEQIGFGAAADALQQRAGFLANEYDRVSAVHKSTPAASISTRLLFDRILHGIEAEQDWTVNAVNRVRAEVANL